MKPRVLLSNIYQLVGLIRMSLFHSGNQPQQDVWITWKLRGTMGPCLHVDGSCDGALGRDGVGGLLWHEDGH